MCEQKRALIMYETTLYVLVGILPFQLLTHHVYWMFDAWFRKSDAQAVLRC
jgi:hypothetical protein